MVQTQTYPELASLDKLDQYFRYLHNASCRKQHFLHEDYVYTLNASVHTASDILGYGLGTFLESYRAIRDLNRDNRQTPILCVYIERLENHPIYAQKYLELFELDNSRILTIHASGDATNVNEMIRGNTAELLKERLRSDMNSFNRALHRAIDQTQGTTFWERLTRSIKELFGWEMPVPLDIKLYLLARTYATSCFRQIEHGNHYYDLLPVFTEEGVENGRKGLPAARERSLMLVW